jgi:asparagine synthase (glutamine-hydrolysing)
MNTKPYILFDGELINVRDKEQTDMELFEDYYLNYGKNCFSYLDGSYCCAIVDSNETIIARDPIGARPLFYGEESGLFCFSTEMKGLVDHIRYNVHELAPGHLYSTKEGLKPFKPYVPETPDPEGIKHATDILRKLVIDAVKKRMNGLNAVSLSGGLDSSILAIIAKQFNPDLLLFTATLESDEGPDLENAKLLANFLGLEHHIYRITESDISDFIPEAIWHLESFDEDCVSGMIANYYVSKLVKPYSNYVLVGEGADELFGGYGTVLKSPRVANERHRGELAKKLLNIAYSTSLRRLDRGWMANAVVYQTPYLDSKVIAFSRKIPMEWKIYGEQQTEKYILRETFKDLLPEQIYKREKLRFALGTGIDNVMDRIVSKLVDRGYMAKLPKSNNGMPCVAFKEAYYHDEFLKRFPPAYEKMTIRWDPFK